VPASSSSPSSLLSVAERAELPSGQLSAVESITLIRALEAVPDHRQRRGRRHSLQSVLLLALGAVMAGARSYAAIAEWAAVAKAPVRPCGRPPSEATFRRVLSAVDVTAVEAALTAWVLGCRRALAAAAQAGRGPVAEHRCVLAVDGKTLRGTRRPDGTQTKLISIYEHGHRLVLAQAGVVDGDEIAAFTTALATLPDLRGVVVTADALHCQREHARWLHARGGHYLFTVKSNQPTLRRTLAALPWAEVEGSRRRDRGHGRIESRSIKVLDLDAHPVRALFPHATRAIKVVRSRRCTATGHRSHETVYAVTSLDYRAADPGLLAAWIRRHWAIENAVHHVRDVTQGEDASRIRTGSGPQVLAALRNTALNLARLDGHANIARAQRQASWIPDAVKQTLATA
jgi:predicted transposase YbfD/YdcC